MNKYAHVDYSMLPDHMRDGAKRYIENRIAPGGFMTAVLENNLVEAASRADSTNINCLKEWAMWLYNECPREAWGSPHKVAMWLESKEETP
jgi:hypothetical protein